ncbi:AAA family ATPase [Bradyrhizobium sp. 14AA]
MEVRLTGWKSQNIRGGLRDIEIDLGNLPPRWTLVQMPNGTGKTTTMSLLRATLSGTELSAQAVRDLRADDTVEEGLFEVRLSIDGKPFRLQMRLDFRDGSCSYWTVRAEARRGGMEEGRALPADLRELLKPSLTELFVFNGELATQIRDLSKKRAADAIRSLYRLDTLDNVKARIDALVEQEQKRAASISSAKEERGIRRLQNARDEVLAAKERLEHQQRTHAARLAEHERERKRLEEEISSRLAEDAGVRERLEKLRDDEAEVEEAAGLLASQALDVLRQPPHVHPRLLQRLQNLGGRLYELKLPETISAEFFRELATKDRCVCGRPIGHAEREEIRTGASRFLAQDQISIINQMKFALRESSGDPDMLSNLIGDLRRQLDRRRDLKAVRDRLASERIAEGDEILLKLRAQIGSCNEELATLTAAVERLTTKDPIRQKALRVTWQTNLPLCDAELKVRSSRLDTATRTRTFALQGERLKDLISHTSSAALDILRERVRNSTNQKLAQIIKNENLQVARIEGGLELSSGGLASKGGVSEGQSLAVAYAFLTALLAEAPYRLPFIVDSPAVSLDTAVRREVGELIPDFFGQMIMFVISSEREGFADAFYERPSDVEYITVIPQGGGKAHVVKGIKPFREFHSREAAQ